MIEKEEKIIIQLRPMNADEFAVYLNTAVGNYAKEKVMAGNWSEAESRERAEKVYRELLPEGEKTENQYLYTALHEGQKHRHIS